MCGQHVPAPFEVGGTFLRVHRTVVLRPISGSFSEAHQAKHGNSGAFLAVNVIADKSGKSLISRITRCLVLSGGEHRTHKRRACMWKRLVFGGHSGLAFAPSEAPGGTVSAFHPSDWTDRERRLGVMSQNRCTVFILLLVRPASDPLTSCLSYFLIHLVQILFHSINWKFVNI